MLKWDGMMVGMVLISLENLENLENQRKSDVVIVTVNPILVQARNPCLLFHKGESPPLSNHQTNR